MKLHTLDTIAKFKEAPAVAAKEGEKKKSEKLWKIGADGAAKGKRHPTATSLLGKMFQSLPKEMWGVPVWGALQAWNQKNEKPLDEKELQRIYESIKKKAEENPNAGQQTEDGSQADTLLELCTEESCILFHDQLGEPYAYFKTPKQWIVRRIGSNDFQNWLRRLFYEKTEKAIADTTLKSVAGLLTCKALYDGSEFHLYNRIAVQKGSIVYNIADESGQTVVIDKKGYNVTSLKEPLFRHYRHQRPQVSPASEGAISDLLPFVNLKGGNKDQELLLLVYTITCFIPDFPHVILVISGEKGSAKSTLLKLIRRIVDPAKPPLLGLSENADDLPQQLDHNYFAPYDNVSGFSRKISDRLCRASTGDGDTKRKLYSDDDDFVREYQRCVALNGINVCAKEPDLLERCLLIELERIPKDKRKTEKQLWVEFDTALPGILNGIFSVLSKAIGKYDTIEAPGRNRMADFEHWGCAIAQALGYSAQKFIEAYERNLGLQNQEAINESDVAIAIVALVELEEGFWEGTTTELREVLEKVAGEEKIDVKDRSWPKRANTLGKRIREVQSNLLDAGIQVETKHTNAGSVITLKRIANHPSSAVTEAIKATESEKSGDGDTNMSGVVPSPLSHDSSQEQAENKNVTDSDS
ncbi:hypothetical protein COU76_04735 [Candidatus Peregrinibacteria bacterium CG10_big_fil_rev_8_21_14_0_10_49_10]|nr:MAG: hypothetical protein COU76_04735 [Candidatus Peregrinibacteria bacterium CG10_big_fil_rev_8_21_14_0_10_49_10]